MKMTTFIEQTARDYNISYEKVLSIYIAYPKTFYNELEKYIEERKNKGVK